MCADADEGLSHPAVQQPQDVSQIVHANIFQTERDKSLPQPFTARSLAKRGRWDFSKLALPAAELHFLIVEIAKSSMHATHFRDASDLALGGSPGAIRNRWTGGHFLTNNYITRRPRERNCQVSPARLFAVLVDLAPQGDAAPKRKRPRWAA
jgi:hypothetical protein